MGYTRVFSPGAVNDLALSGFYYSSLFGPPDLAAALAGSIGIGPTANINPERQFPSMFEPIHGSAFDIAGKGVADPSSLIAALRLAAELAGRRSRD